MLQQHSPKRQREKVREARDKPVRIYLFKYSFPEVPVVGNTSWARLTYNGTDVLGAPIWGEKQPYLPLREPLSEFRRDTQNFMVDHCYVSSEENQSAETNARILFEKSQYANQTHYYILV
jgi:hypothetical protein